MKSNYKTYKEMKKTKTPYLIGMDIGTNSVGIAMTDKDYNVINVNGKRAMCSRKLGKAETATKRRAARGARIRIDRNQTRQSFVLDALIDIFENLNPNFATYIKESGLHENDRSVPLSESEKQRIRRINKEYPTIHHKIMACINNTAEEDELWVESLYYMTSHRGHRHYDFDYRNMSEEFTFEKVWNNTAEILSENFGIELACKKVIDIEKIIKNKKLKIREKVKNLKLLFNISAADKKADAVIKLLVGGTVNSSALFATNEYDNTEAKKISFKLGYGDNEDIYKNVLGDNFEMIQALHDVYSCVLISDIMNNEKYLAMAKIKEYDKYSYQLDSLKALIKEYVPEKYSLVFRDKNTNMYNYVKFLKTGDSAEFYKFINTIIPAIECVDEKYADIYNSIERGEFLVRLVNSNNSVIPYQLHKIEFEAILENMKKRYPAIENRDADGYSNEDKIRACFDFVVPYFVGHLHVGGEGSWIVRREAGRIYPWNIEKKVDYEKTAEAFIRTKIGKCTYLSENSVMPKNSLIYTKFIVLNELNNLCVNGEKISVEDKQNIYNLYYMTKGKPSKKDIKDYFKLRGINVETITGIDDNFKNSIKPILDFSLFNLTDDEKENIITVITTMGKNKKMIENKIRKEYGDKLSDEEIKKICSLKYDGWGNLSIEFLTGIYDVDEETGEARNIMTMLWETNNNLMQLLSSSYSFAEQVTQASIENNKNKKLNDMLDALYASPAIRRPILQSIRMLEEYIQIMGYAPETIYIESTRYEETNKQKTESRKESLKNKLRPFAKKYPELWQELEAITESKLQNKLVYLYFLQLGECMYTGKKINLSDIGNIKTVDKDHIFPKSKFPDNSLDNLVLVCRSSNEDKGAEPLNDEIRAKRRDFWKFLLDKKLLSPKKYKRLMQEGGVNENDINDFLNRQLTETSQTIKIVKTILNIYYPETKVVLVKAGIVSDFRNEVLKMSKCREMNDLHHAKDAYLTIVVGRVYTAKMTKRYFCKDVLNGKTSLKRMFDFSVPGVWNAENSQSLKNVKREMHNNNICCTQYSYEQTGVLSKQTIFPKGNGQMPLKKSGPMSDISKYGGMNNATAAFAEIIRYIDNNGEQKIAFESVENYMMPEYKKNPEAYYEKKLNVNNVEILAPVKYGELIELNGERFYYSGKAGKSITLRQSKPLVVPLEQEEYIKKITNYRKKCEKLKTELEITKWDQLSEAQNIELYDCFVDKLCGEYSYKLGGIGKKLANAKDKFLKLPLNEQCKDLYEMLAFFRNDKTAADLTNLNTHKGDKTFAKSMGIIGNAKLIGKDITSLRIIHQSYTGLKETVVDVLNRDKIKEGA